MNVLHLPSAVCGIPYGLSRVERAAGIHSDVLQLYSHANGYPADIPVFDRPSGKKSDMLRIATLFPGLLKNYDVFHFNYGSTLIDAPSLGIHMADLPFYKMAGKRVVVTYAGCDARQKYPTIHRTEHGISACKNMQCYNGICNSGALDASRKARIEKFDKYADAIFAMNPDLMYFLPSRAKFLPYMIAGWDTITPEPYHPHTPLRIVHLTTDVGAKGSLFISQIFELLHLKYGKEAVETWVVEGVSHERALMALRNADLVIDQLRIGWYGTAAVEAMRMGKPVVAYIREEDLHFIPPAMAEDVKKSVVFASTKNLYPTLRLLVENPSLLTTYSRNGSVFVERWHSPEYILPLLKEAYAVSTAPR
jgi:hypothetical protein